MLDSWTQTKSSKYYALSSVKIHKKHHVTLHTPDSINPALANAASEHLKHKDINLGL